MRRRSTITTCASTIRTAPIWSTTWRLEAAASERRTCPGRERSGSRVVVRECCVGPPEQRLAVDLAHDPPLHLDLWVGPDHLEIEHGSAGCSASSIRPRTCTTSSGATHQIDQENTTRSNAPRSISSSCADAARTTTFSASIPGSERWARAMHSASGSNASTWLAPAAIPAVRRPSPQPISVSRRRAAMRRLRDPEFAARDGLSRTHSRGLLVHRSPGPKPQRHRVGLNG